MHRRCSVIPCTVHSSASRAPEYSVADYSAIAGLSVEPCAQTEHVSRSATEAVAELGQVIGAQCTYEPVGDVPASLGRAEAQLPRRCPDRLRAQTRANPAAEKGRCNLPRCNIRASLRSANQQRCRVKGAICSLHSRAGGVQYISLAKLGPKRQRLALMSQVTGQARSHDQGTLNTR